MNKKTLYGCVVGDGSFMGGLRIRLIERHLVLLAAMFT